jgi:hypothetical protein
MPDLMALFFLRTSSRRSTPLALVGELSQPEELLACPRRVNGCRHGASYALSTNDPVFPLNKLQQRYPDHPVVIAHVQDIWSI